MVWDDNFFMWSIVEAWNWLIHLTVLGFVILVLLVLFVGIWVAVLTLILSD